MQQKSMDSFNNMTMLWQCGNRHLILLVLGEGRRPNLCGNVLYMPLSGVLEHNSCTFHDRFLDKKVLQNRIRRLASIWCKAHDLLDDFPSQTC